MSRVALVTGGGRGIGRAIAAAFAAEGTDVAIAGRGEEALQETAAAIGDAVRVTTHVCDVGDEAAVAGLFEQVLGEHDRLDVLVNNAAIAGPTAPLAELSIDDWDEVQRINVRGAVLCTQQAARHMVPRGEGAILFLSALGGVRAYPLRLPYAVSKAALLAVTQTVAAELRPHGISVNALTPGPVSGERLDRVFSRRAEETGQSVEEVAAALASKAPAGRFATEDEVARVALWLCGPEAEMLVGTSVNITGGIEIVQ
ncbi:MAG: SDR family NAD(P)-dependent oxidoreductase [Solirubrobacterales bacterium]